MLTVFCTDSGLGGVCDVTLEQVLGFTTGSMIPPPMGFHGCSLLFSLEDPYPTSSTCSMELTLPLKY